jgi:hypothetical protein
MPFHDFVDLKGAVQAASDPSHVGGLQFPRALKTSQIPFSLNPTVVWFPNPVALTAMALWTVSPVRPPRLGPKNTMA